MPTKRKHAKPTRDADLYSVDAAGSSITAKDDTVIVATFPVTITLPPADAKILGLPYFVRNGSNQGPVTVAAGAGDNINGQSTLTLSSLNDAAMLVCTDLGSWSVLAGYSD